MLLIAIELKQIFHCPVLEFTIERIEHSINTSAVSVG